MNNELKKALEYVNEGKMEQGLALLHKVSEKGNDQLKYEAAQLYYDLGLVDLAKPLIEGLRMSYPDEGELSTFMAEILIDFDQEDEAIELLLEINETDPAYAQAQLLLADLYQLQGLDEVAEQKLLQAEGKVPQEPVVQFALGEFYLGRGDYLKSIPYFKRVLPYQQELNSLNVFLRLAEAYSASGYFEEAISYYEQGITMDASVDDFFGYGYTAFQIENYVVAIKQFEEVLTMDESYSSLYPFLAEAYEEVGKVREAMAILKKGIEIDEYNEALFLQAARLSLKEGQPEEGEQLLRKLLALNPSNFSAATMLAGLLKQAEQFSELAELIVFLKGQGEEDPLFQWYLATARKNLDDDDDHLPAYQQLSLHFSEDSDFLEEYGDLLIENGFVDQGKEMLKKAYALDHTKYYLQHLIE